jgi:hypothetical protein
MEWLPMKPEPPVTRTVLITALPYRANAPAIMQQSLRDQSVPSDFENSGPFYDVICHSTPFRPAPCEFQ